MAAPGSQYWEKAGRAKVMKSRRRRNGTIETCRGADEMEGMVKGNGFTFSSGYREYQGLASR